MDNTSLLEDETLDKIEELTNRTQFWKDVTEVEYGLALLNSPPGSLIMSGMAIGIGVLTRECLMKVWKKTTGRNPPENPAAQSVTWTDAAIWPLQLEQRSDLRVSWPGGVQPLLFVVITPIGKLGKTKPAVTKQLAGSILERTLMAYFRTAQLPPTLFPSKSQSA